MLGQSGAHMVLCSSPSASRLLVIEAVAIADYIKIKPS